MLISEGFSYIFVPKNQSERCVGMKKYLSISNDIREQILAGTYKAGEKIPFEKELGVTYDASKMTVKKALDILVAEGLIIKRRGSGTFVKDLSTAEMERIAVSNQFRGTTAIHPGKTVKSTVLNFSVIEASELVRSKLNLSEGSLVYKIYRVRSIDDIPEIVETTYMPIEQIPGLERNHVEGSIYEYIEDELGLKIQSGHRRITVRRATDIEMEYLKLEVYEPVAVAEQIAYFDTGTAFEYSTSVHRHENYAVEMILTRD